MMHQSNNPEEIEQINQLVDIAINAVLGITYLTEDDNSQIIEHLNELRIIEEDSEPEIYNINHYRANF